jgi:hypothetical protein
LDVLDGGLDVALAVEFDVALADVFDVDMEATGTVEE